MLKTDDHLRDRADKAQQVLIEQNAKIGDLFWLMSDQRGRRFIWRLLSDAGISRLSYAPGSNAQDIAFLEGERNSGLRMQALILEHCPERYLEMIKEAHERRDAK